MTEQTLSPAPLKSNELKDTGYELFILALSLLSIANLVMDGFFQDPEQRAIIFIVDIALSFIFMADFLYRLFSAESKPDYFFKQLGWLDFLGSLPFPRIRILRLARIIRALRLMRVFGLKNMVKEFLLDRAGSTLFSVGLLAIFMIEFGSMAILYLEGSSAEANIQTGPEAVWWALVTMSTVGYGDFYPVTDNGRLMSAFFIVLGVGLFGVITGFLANSFLGDDEEDEEPGGEPAPSLPLVMAELQKLQQNQAQSNHELQQRLAALETLLQAQQK